MATVPVTCRTCGSARTTQIGPLPDVDVFAGTRLDRALPGGWLHACRHCSFLFRAPVLADDDYVALYARGSANVWEQNPDREDFRLVRHEVQDAAIDVLDIGCYTGELLALLPKACRVHGVEPNPAAAALAKGRGVRIVATQWNALADGATYDIITACDVIEHVGNPLDFLSSLSRHLKPGGRLIITTGNAEAWPWKLTGSRFWYSHFPEHISFIGPPWLAKMAPRAGLQVQRVQPFSHSPLPGLAARALALAKTCIRLLANPRGRASALMLGGDIAPDHIVCVLRRA